jgi:hypothetical protein
LRNTHLLQGFGKTLVRKEVEAGIGLIQWITRVFPQLRPYLCFFYRILAKADPIQHTWSRKQLADKMAIMNETCSYISRNTDGAVQKSLKLYKLDNTYIKSLQDVKDFRFGASRRGMARVLLLDPRGRNVRADEEASRVAGIWLSAIQGMPMWSPMVRLPPPEGLCMRADAHAEGNCLGIGGWAGFPGRDWCRTELRWFSLQFTINDFPASWNLQEACTSDRTNRLEGHRIIAGLETLAQTVLLVMTRDFLAQRCGPCYLPVESDNAPTVGALNKIFSNK